MYKSSLYAVGTRARSKPHYKLLDPVACVQQYKLLLLRLYQFYKINPADAEFMKHLARWYRKWGRQYKRDVEALA